MTLIYYSIEKNAREEYVVWRNISTKYSYGNYFVFKGTRNECIEFCKCNKLKVVRKWEDLK